jgi:hypothetical protein
MFEAEAELEGEEDGEERAKDCVVPDAKEVVEVGEG